MFCSTGNWIAWVRGFPGVRIWFSKLSSLYFWLGLQLSTRNSWYSFLWPWKDERLIRAWNHPVVLNMGSLDWECSTLTTKPLLKLKQKNCKSCKNRNCKSELTKMSLPHKTSSLEVSLFFEILIQRLNRKPFSPSTLYCLKRRTLCGAITWQVDFTISFFHMLAIFNI